MQRTTQKDNALVLDPLYTDTAGSQVNIQYKEKRRDRMDQRNSSSNVYVLSFPVALVKRKSLCFLKFNSRKEGKKWLRNQLREYESFFIDMALDLKIKEMESRKFPSKQDLMKHFILDENQVNAFASKYIY